MVAACIRCRKSSSRFRCLPVPQSVSGPVKQFTKTGIVTVASDSESREYAAIGRGITAESRRAAAREIQ